MLGNLSVFIGLTAFMHGESYKHFGCHSVSLSAQQKILFKTTLIRLLQFWKSIV